ncbi:hypothetical protein Tco_0047082 [Tanacetum coccineum]
MTTMAENVLAAGAENRLPLLEKGGYDKITVPATETTTKTKRMQELKDLTPEEKTRISCDIKATNIILLGLPSDIYTFSNHHKIARDILNMVKELIEGTELTKQERESKLYDKFDRFTTDKVEAIKSYYLRYAKFVTAAKQAKNFHYVRFNQLYAYLKQNENDANEIGTMRQRFPDPLANTYNPPPSYISQKSQYNQQPSKLLQYQPIIPPP